MGIRNRRGENRFDNTHPSYMPKWNGWEDTIYQIWSAAIDAADDVMQEEKFMVQTELRGLNAWEWPEMVKAGFLNKEDQLLDEFKEQWANQTTSRGWWEWVTTVGRLQEMDRQPPMAHYRQVFQSDKGIW